MDSTICYNCGAVREHGGGTSACPVCGAIALEALPARKRLAKAFTLLRESRFDEAKTAFEAILNKYPETALAYWGRLRARYHITYVLGANEKLVPKCPTLSGANVFEDADYLKATEYANEEEKAFLQAQAEHIKSTCTEIMGSKNRVDRFTFGEVDKNDAFLILPKSKKPLIVSAVVSFLLIVATSVCFATGVFHRHTPGTEANCLEPQICVKCNEILVAALGHTAGAEANCTDAQTCTLCNVELVAALGHRPGEGATCETAQVCGVCNTELVVPLGHKPGAEATCTEAQTCTICKKELTPATGHSHIATTTAATCTEQGYTTHTCACGDTYRDNYITALGHTPSKEATCTRAQTCTVCNVKLADMLEHTPSAEATCTTAQNCTVCYKRLVDALGHVTGEWEIVTPATKTEDGLRVQVCTRCNEIQIRETISAGSTGLAFTQNSNGTYSVSGIGICTDTDVVIPSTYNGQPVTGIGDYAFRDCSSLTSIVIPKGVTSIGHSAFFNCISLTSIVIPKGVTSIGDGAFYNCSGLTNISIPDGLTSIGSSAFYGCSGLTSIAIPDGLTSIGSSAFYGCSSLTSISIPDGVTSIGDSAFYNCSGLTSIAIPDSVTRIGDYAFVGCSSLTSIAIPDSVTNIGKYAFWNCSSLTSIAIPDGVTSIGERVFEGCSSLTEISVHENNSYYRSENGVLFNKNKTELICYPAGKTENSYSIPDGVTSIGDYAFYNCRGLTSIAIPDSMTSIGDYAFVGCSSLTRIAIPDSVTNIGDYAFWSCSSLTSLVIPDSVTSIGIYAFNNCSSLYVVYNNSNLQLSFNSTDHGYIAYYANIIADKNGNKTYKEEGSEITYIDTEEGFLFKKNNDTYQLIAYFGEEETVTLPTNINGNAYTIYNMRGVRNVIIPDGVTSIGDYAFYNCRSLSSIVIPDSVTNIGDYAFCNCSSLTSLVIPNGVTSIGNSVLEGCGNLTSIVIPNGVTSIGDFAFRHCSSLTSIVIPDSVTSIGRHAFFNCSSLKSVTIPEGVTSIGSGSFSKCSNLTEISVHENNAYYCSENGVLFNKDKMMLICYPAGKTEKSYSFSNNVTSIGSDAFYGCSNLTSIVIPDGVTSIGDSAFCYCTGLTSVTIGNGVKSIWGYAFSSCTSLTSIVIPNGVKSIGDLVFSGCSSLIDIQFGGTIEQWQAITFGSDWNNRTGNYTVTCTDGTVAKDGTVTYY